ncbi:MAG: FAD:protein FMN transferase [Chloroflexi bacterium]|nr:FAD:protein FMN transferase [Chloroflexota bacterium]
MGDRKVPGAEFQTTRFRAMNTDIELVAAGPSTSIDIGFRQATDFIHRNEARLTRFSETSELSALNRSAGAWFHTSPELFEVIWQARRYYDETHGLFDPAILPALEQAGYDRSMDEIRAAGPQPAQPAQKLPYQDFRQVQFDRTRRRIRLPDTLRLDLGGIAKGWIAEGAAQVLAAYSAACAVSAGGDIVMIGLPQGASVWTIDLEDPRNPELVLTTLHSPPGAVATSTTTRRHWLQGGQKRHHLIDPRTGAPAATQWLSVSVIAPHAPMAEAFAKALLIAGPRETGRIFSNKPDLTFIAIDQSGQMWGSGLAKELLHVPSDISSETH